MTTEDLSKQLLAKEADDDLVKAVRLAGPRSLGESERETLAIDPASVDDLPDRMVVEFAKAFKTLRIGNGLDPGGGVVDPLHEVRELTRALLARGRRGDEEAVSRFEFIVADKLPKQRKVTVVMSLDTAAIRVAGVPARHGINGIVREVGDYFKYGRGGARRDGRVNHYLTGKFAPARESEVLVIIDNSRVRGDNGIDCQGRAIRARNGTPGFVAVGNGVRKSVSEDGSKIQLIAARTGVVVPVYDEKDILRSIDVRESVSVGEVGHREGGHIAARGAGGRAAELDVEETSVESVPPAFVIRTTGTVNVQQTIFGEVLASAINAEMINAAGKTVAAREALTVRRVVQATVLHARAILVGQGRVSGSIINSTFHVRNSFTAVNLKLLGNNTLRLGSDLLDGKTPATGAAHIKSDARAWRGEDLFAGRVGISQEREAAKREYNQVLAAIRDGLQGQMKKQISIGRGGLDFRTLLAAIAAADQEYSRCPVEEEEAKSQVLVNALMDLGVQDTLTFMRRFMAKKKLQGDLVGVAGQLAAISPPLTVELNKIVINDSARLTIRCWDDVVILQRIGSEIIVGREEPAEELFRGTQSLLSLTVSFDYEAGRLVCSVPPP